MDQSMTMAKLMATTIMFGPFIFAGFATIGVSQKGDGVFPGISTVIISFVLAYYFFRYA